MTESSDTGTGEGAKFGIFISYRRRDTAAGYAGRLRGDLRREFPDAEIFFDVESMPQFIGKKFSVIIDRDARLLPTCCWR